jgi:uroporphyrinogen III methyltransferase/synthase
MTFAPDLVTFTSSSTVSNFCDALGEERVAAVRDEAAFASIGPVTSKTARERGFTVAVEPAQHDIPSLVHAIRGWNAAR